jgi:hypothetical protein
VCGVELEECDYWAVMAAGLLVWQGPSAINTALNVPPV